jgi:hypothetical protein
VEGSSARAPARDQDVKVVADALAQAIRARYDFRADPA